MQKISNRTLYAALRTAVAAARLLLTLAIAGAAFTPAHAFELFGYSFFEDGADEREADIIDPVAYEVTLEFAGGIDDLRDVIEPNSLLMRQQQQPTSGTVGLISRAQDDEVHLIAVLYEHGYYGGLVEITVAGRQIGHIGLTETLSNGGQPVAVRIRIDPGPVFHFGALSVGTAGGEIDELAVATGAGLVSGEVARSTIVLDAENALLSAWSQVGHPFPEIIERRVIADHETRTIDVSLRVDPGPEAVFGDVTVEGAERIDPDFVMRHANIPQGAPYDSRELDRARINLRRLEALGGAVIKPASRLVSDGRLPIVIEISERKRHVIGGGAIFSSTEGAEVQAYWKHRNLLGQGEVLRLDGSVGRIFEATDFENLDLGAAVDFHKPGVLDPGTDLDLKAGFTQEDPDPYHREALFFEGFLSHRWSDRLTLRTGGEIDASWIDDAFGSDEFILIGAPVYAVYDTRDDPLNAAEGLFLRLFGEPLVDLNGGAAFFKADAELRHFYALDEDARIIVATRGQIGTIAGAPLADIPAHRRFYAGGAGSVRGYDLFDIGPRVPGLGATGGRSRIEGSVEARVRATDTIGLVAFVDAGLVSTEPTFSGIDDFQAGAGVGVRYFTAVGPLRLDVAFPINPRSGDPAVAFYLGIGQAF